MRKLERKTSSRLDQLQQKTTFAGVLQAESAAGP
jgi:hypothetical protein